MKQLADDAAELLPQDDADGGKKRGRGRHKKDLRLMDALHQSWQGKVGGSWLACARARTCTHAACQALPARRVSPGSPRCCLQAACRHAGMEQPPSSSPCTVPC
jgi:hypothetical protein